MLCIINDMCSELNAIDQITVDVDHLPLGCDPKHVRVQLPSKSEVDVFRGRAHDPSKVIERMLSEDQGLDKAQMADTQ
jgi:hypothetical protein